MGLVYTPELVATMTLQQRAAAIKRELGVLSTLRRQQPARRRSLDSVTFGDLIGNTNLWLAADAPGRRLVEQYAVLAILLQVSGHSLVNGRRPLPELIEMARAEVARAKDAAKLQRDGSPQEWAETWVNRGS